MSSKHSNVAVIVAVYNEEPMIGVVVSSLKQEFAHVVCVNDGSRDASANVIEKSGAYLINHPFNMGQGAALQTGAEFAREISGVDYFVHFDADGQHSVDDAIKMIEELKKGDYDIILGSRFLGQAVGMKRAKKAIFKLAIWFSNAVTGLKLTDTHNGLRVFNRTVAEGMQITMPDMSHGTEILEIITDNKYRYKEMPVTISYSDYSTSKGQGLMNTINIGFDALLRKISR